jgi:hypothetical protein
MWPLIALGAGAIGSFFKGGSEQQAKNRSNKLESQMDLEQILMQRELAEQQQRIAREQEGRASGNDAFRRLMVAQRTLAPGPRPQLSPYSVKPRQATDVERQGADAMTQEVMARLTGGNPIPQYQPRPLEVDRRLMNPSGSEKWLGLLGGGLGAASDFYNTWKKTP